MSRYDLIYMRDHCIDLYFRYKGKFFHVLTYGTTIPQILDNVEANRALQHQMAVRIDEWQGNGEVNIEQGYVQSVRNGALSAIGDNENSERWLPSNSRILQMFEPMAKLGFYSYDCVQELENGKGLYRLVAYPGSGIVKRQYDGMPEFEGIEIVEEDEDREIILQFRM